MKTFRIVISIVVFLFMLSAQAQKVKLKKGNVLVDKVEWLKYEDCGGSDDVCSILNQKGEEIIFIKFIQQSSDYLLFNKGGKPNYQKVSFLGTDKKIEIREHNKDILKILYKSKCVKENGTLDMDKVNLLVEKYGNSFSKS